jgi:hypothetical protein
MVERRRESRAKTYTSAAPRQVLPLHLMRTQRVFGFLIERWAPGGFLDLVPPTGFVPADSFEDTRGWPECHIPITVCP